MEKKDYSPTKEQVEIINAQDRIIVVNAMAGTGKTSTLVKFCENKLKKNPKTTFMYFTFNGSMGKEAKKSFSHIGENMLFCGTIHSYALKNVGYSNEIKERIAENKRLRGYMLRELLNCNDTFALDLMVEALKGFTNSDLSIMSFPLESCLNTKQIEILEEVFGGEYNIRAKLKILWDEIIRNKEYPLEHDFYLKLFQLKNPKLQCDYLLVDEAQDLNPTMFSIVKNQDCNIVLVGDTHQQIYSFRGCINALSEFRNISEAKYFYLTKTFRCPQHIVDFAVPYLKLKNVPDERMLNGFLKREEKKNNQKTIICRTNAGIIDYLITSKDSEVGFVGGKSSYDFEKIIDIILVLSEKEESKQYIRDDLLKYLQNKENFLEYLRNNDDVELRGKFNILIKMFSSNVDVINFIKNIKDYGASAKTLITTAHKSKGLEWDNVELYEDFPNIRELEEISEEELNLLYVAITRAKNSIWIPSQYIIENEEVLKRIRKNTAIKTFKNGEWNA